MSLVNKSTWLYHSKEHTASLESARQAYAFAAAELPGSRKLQKAALHLAAPYHSMN